MEATRFMLIQVIFPVCLLLKKKKKYLSLFLIEIILNIL